MPIVQIVPMPGGPPEFDPKTGITIDRDCFAVIFEHTGSGDDPPQLPSEDQKEEYNKWAFACGAKAVVHTVESFTVFYAGQRFPDLDTVGRCPSACQNPLENDSLEHDAVEPELIPCDLLAGHAGRHTAVIEDGMILVWGDLEVWPFPPTFLPAAA